MSYASTDSRRNVNEQPEWLTTVTRYVHCVRGVAPIHKRTFAGHHSPATLAEHQCDGAAQL